MLEAAAEDRMATVLDGGRVHTTAGTGGLDPAEVRRAYDGTSYCFPACQGPGQGLALAPCFGPGRPPARALLVPGAWLHRGTAPDRADVPAALGRLRARLEQTLAGADARLPD